MVIQCGWVLLMSEVPLYSIVQRGHSVSSCSEVQTNYCTMQPKCGAWVNPKPGPLKRGKISTEFMTSDRKLKSSREGSKLWIYGT